MTITFLAPDGVPLTAQQERQANAARHGGGAGRPLGGRSGFRVGTPSNILTATSTTWTLVPCSAMIDPGAATHQGMYGWATDANVTGGVDAADATYARKDIVYIQINDSSSGDGSGALTANVLYAAGTPSASPVAPALTGTRVRSFLVGTITVPQVGGGSPAVVLNPARYVSAGAPLPVFSDTERDALVKYPTSQVIRGDVRGKIQTCDGTLWLGGEHAEFTGKYGVTANVLWGTGPLTKDTAKSELDALITSSSNDIVTLPPGDWDFDWNVSMTNGLTGGSAAPVNATGQTWLSIRDASDTEIKQYDIDTGRSKGGASVNGFLLPAGGTVKFKFFTVTTGVTLESRIRIKRAG